MTRILAFILFLACVLQSCVSPQGTISRADYNGRRYLQGASYKVKKKPFAVTINVGAGVAGAVIASNKNIVNYYDGTERKTLQPANAVIGAMIGYAAGNLFTRMLGLHKNTTKVPENEQEMKQWIRKQKVIAGNYEFLRYNQIIEGKYESNYTVKNLQDVRDFKKAFPNSSYSNAVVDKAMKQFNREDLYTLSKMYPGRKDDIKEVYFAKTYTMPQCKEAIEKFPSLKDAATLKAYKRISALISTKDFKKYFPYEYKYHTRIVEDFYPKSNKKDLITLINRFPKASNINKVKQRLASLNAKIQKDIANGTFNGYDSYKYSYGAYTGNFKNGKPHGYGEMSYTNGERFKGQWSYGNKNGNGTYYYTKNDVDGRAKYEGNWKNDEKSGQGTMWYGKNDKYDRERYEGSWQSGSRNGKGTLYWNNGAWHSGYWKNGYRHGQAEYRTSSGHRYYGNWVEGKKEGNFTIKFWNIFGSREEKVVYRNGNEVSRYTVKDTFPSSKNSSNNNTPCATVVDENYNTGYSCDMKYIIKQIKCRDGSYEKIYYWPGGSDCYTKDATYFEVNWPDDYNLRTNDWNEALKKICNCDD